LRTIVATVFIGFLIQFGASGQNNIFAPFDDTLTFYHRVGGSIDTFDLQYTFPLTSVPSGTIGKYNAVPTIDLFRNSTSLFLHQLPQLKNDWVISALPHIGFFYSFGTKGTQFLHADYQQSFLNNSLLNLEINRSSSSKGKAMIRNGDFSTQDFSAAYRFGKKRFMAQVKATYLQSSHGLNGGVENDSTWLVQGLAFAPIFKEKANSQQRFINSEGIFKFHLLTDSLSLRTGIISKHKYSVWNRVYNEVTDSLSKIYPFINIDGDTTRDQFQDTKLKNSVGIFVENSRFNASLFGSHRYWRFQNLGTSIAQNEISTELFFGINSRKLKVNSENYFNIAGAENEFSSRSSAKWGGSNKFISVNLSIESLLPILVQRFYYGNNLAYTSALKKQTRTDMNISGVYTFWKMDAIITFGALAWQNNLQWQNYSWSNGSQSNLAVSYIKTKFHLDFNWFQAYPELQINYGSDFLPKTILSGRFLVKKKVFAAKKLELLFALDPQLTDKYNLMSYNTLLDNWYFDSNNRLGGQIFSLHSTFTMQIEEFKFFIRTENLQAFWAPKNTEIAQNYFRPSFILRLGISWDFFN
jgi:hypothetical protein